MVTSSRVRPLAWKLSNHARLHRLGEALTVFVQLVQGLGRGIAPQRAHDLGLEQVSDLLRIEGALAEAAGGCEQVVLAATDVGIELRDHVDANLVRGEHRLVPGPAHDELDGLQGYPGHLVEHRQHHRAPAQAHLGAQEAGADEPHVRGRTLVHPDRDDVEDRDDDDRENDEGNQGFHGRRSRCLESRGSPESGISRRIPAIARMTLWRRRCYRENDVISLNGLPRWQATPLSGKKLQQGIPPTKRMTGRVSRVATAIRPICGNPRKPMGYGWFHRNGKSSRRISPDRLTLCSSVTNSLKFRKFFHVQLKTGQQRSPFLPPPQTSAGGKSMAIVSLTQSRVNGRRLD